MPFGSADEDALADALPTVSGFDSPHATAKTARSAVAPLLAHRRLRTMAGLLIKNGVYRQ